MPPFDYSDPPPSKFEPKIPEGTKTTVVIHVKQGGVGEDQMLTRSKDGGCEMLVAELTIVDGAYKGRKIFERWILAGTTDGHAKSADINRGTLKAILDSALGLKPDDISPQARAARTVSLKDFEGKTFLGKIGVEKGKPKNDGSGENWPDRNILAAVITPDKKEWRASEQPPPFNGGNSGGAATPSSSSALPIERPGWAS